MAEKKISDLTGKDNIGDNDELVFVDKATTSGTDAGVEGQTSKIKFSDLKDAVGTSGPQGSQGAKGFQGNNGNQGAKGFQGNNGNQGQKGSQGNNGNQGQKGAQGNVGNQGQKGFQGNTGTGLQGKQGHQGIKGFQGNVGNQGLRGFQGAESGMKGVRAILHCVRSKSGQTYFAAEGNAWRLGERSWNVASVTWPPGTGSDDFSNNLRFTLNFDITNPIIFAPASGIGRFTTASGFYNNPNFVQPEVNGRVIDLYFMQDRYQTNSAQNPGPAINYLEWYGLVF